MKPILTLAPAILVAFLGMSVAPAPVQAQDTLYHGGSLDAHRHGYEHGYRDGFEYGVDVKSRGGSLDFRTDAYRDAIRGYDPAFGSREAFSQGYREGYQSGAEDGFNGSISRLEQTYSYTDRGFDPDRNREDRTVTIYTERHWGYQDVAGDVGYRDGVNAGLHDYREHHSYRPSEHDAWKDADHGYSSAFGAKEAYKQAYRAAYEAGYRDGFGLRR